VSVGADGAGPVLLRENRTVIVEEKGQMVLDQILARDLFAIIACIRTLGLLTHTHTHTHIGRPDTNS
jgi:hypothetical protein